MGSSVLTGDPLEKAASYSRFILPFAYRREVSHEPVREGQPHFAPAEADDWLHQPRFESSERTSEVGQDVFLDRGRLRYLTHETATVLFHRAEWFVLQPRGGRIWHEFEVKRSEPANGTFHVSIRPPALVLFEWDCCPNGDEEDVLQTGLIVFEAFFPDGKDQSGPTPDDILRFNEYFRFWRRPYPGHERNKKGVRPPNLEAVEHGWPLKAGKPFGHEGSEWDDEAERDIYTGRWTSLMRLPIRKRPDHGGVTLLKAPVNRCRPVPAHPAWAVNADERAYVVSCTLLNPIPNGGVVESSSSEEPTEVLKKWANSEEAPAGISYWVRLLNADGPGNSNATRYECEWVKQRTYRRWLDYGTAYGFTDHSSAMLSATPPEDLPTWRHFGQMYFDQLLLMLYVRASIFRFSRRLSEISIQGREADAHRNSSDQLKVRESFGELRRQFDWFTNLYRFPLLSTQQQSVEMFEILSKGLDIEEIYKEVENEIDGTLEALELEATQTFAKVATVLGFLGTLGLLAGVVQGVMSLSWFIDKKDDWKLVMLWLTGGGVVAILVLAPAAFYWSRRLEVLLLWMKSRKGPCRHDC